MVAPLRMKKDTVMETKDGQKIIMHGDEVMRLDESAAQRASRRLINHKLLPEFGGSFGGRFHFEVPFKQICQKTA
jgi:hypothetical protein